MSEAVNHPAHYNSSEARRSHCDHPIECIDVIEHMPLNLGNAVKYIWREGLKGAAIEDLEKAVWYIQREIARRKAEHVRKQAMQLRTARVPHRLVLTFPWRKAA